MTKKGGRIELIVGPMFSGKSSELIRRTTRYIIADSKVQLYKPKIDKRYSIEDIVSHDDRKIRAVPINVTEEIEKSFKDDTEVLAIDEIQFLDDKIISYIDDLADKGKIVIASGLNLDFRGEPFPFKESQKTMKDLIVIADYVETLTAICTYLDKGKKCGVEATRTQRIIDDKPAPYDSPIILVGAADSYEARCRLHHIVPGKPKK